MNDDTLEDVPICIACGEEFSKRFKDIGSSYCPLCRHLRKSGMPDQYLEPNRSYFNEKMQEYFDSDDSLYISGIVGTGKTWFMSVIMREAIRRTKKKEFHDDFPSYSKSILFTSVPELMMMVKDTMSPGSEITERQILDKYSKVPVLFLDDIGADYTTDYVRAFLYLLIERRGTSRGLRTVITSNLDLEELPKRHGERISSRISGMCRPVKISGKDRRSEKKK